MHARHTMQCVAPRCACALRKVLLMNNVVWPAATCCDSDASEPLSYPLAKLDFGALGFPVTCKRPVHPG